MTELDRELADVLATIRRRYDVIPFMQRSLPTGSARIIALPDDMTRVLEGSPDFHLPPSGGDPTWYQISTGNDHAELVIYRSQHDGRCYVIAPSANEGNET